MISISECDKEPIHTPGAIQQFGFLFVLNKENLTVEQVSDNLSNFLELTPSETFGKSLNDLFESRYHVLGSFDFSSQTENFFVIECEHKKTREHSFFEFSTIIQPHYVIVDVIPVAEKMRSHEIMGKLEMTIERLEKSKTLAELCETVVDEVQKTTAFDRVMMYRFDEEWFGTVVAEKLSRSEVDSYLNHRFPASDIPAQARKMLCENLLRIIPDVHYRPSSLVPLNNPRTREPTDIGRSLLRSPSPIHIQYLKNMEVGASLTVRIIREGRLWGLIACQHETAKDISMDERFCSRIIGRVVSSLISSIEKEENFKLSNKLNENIEKIHQNLKGSSALTELLTKKNPSIGELNPVEGASFAIHNNKEWVLSGETPSQSEMIALARWIKKDHGDDEVFVTDSLMKVYPVALNFKNPVAGVLVISLPYGRDNFIMWFRPELERMVTWAGDPKKTEELREDKLVLHPRKSFEGWKEKVKFRSVPWKSSEVEAFRKLKRYIIEYKLLKKYKEFEVLADSIEQFIWVSSADGRPEFYNKKWFEVTGLGTDLTHPDVCGESLIHPEDLPRARELWRKSMNEGVPFTCEIRFRTKEGHYQWNLCHTTPARDEQGKIMKWYGSGVNIQDIKEIQSDLKKALSVRDEFISLASHELKTPITSLGLLLELTGRGLEKSKDVSAYVQKSIQELKRLRYLVDDLLDVTKINSGKIEFSFKEHDINKIVYHVLERYQNDQRIIPLLEKFKKNPPFHVYCDAFRVEQVITNLISNALKYGEGKPIDVQVEPSKEQVTFLVKDHGMGISPQDQEKLFNRFQRVGKTKGISGLGLGLYICKSIIDSHQGKIGLESELGKGTTFYFKIPIRK